MIRDKALVDQLLSGDDEAFEEFFQAYFPRLFRFAVVRLNYDKDAAEEVVQATLTRVIQKLETYRGEASLFTWLCTFCRHEISAFYKKSQRQPSQIDLIEEIPEIRAALESLIDTASDQPDDRLRRKEIGRLVRVTLDHLPPHYGDALEWKYIQGFSVREIATQLGVSPKATESLLTRARQAFRDAFGTLTSSLEIGRLEPVEDSR
jgi:RNA polymerase sigma-70 factor (ECF subfamily)